MSQTPITPSKVTQKSAGLNRPYWFAMLALMLGIMVSAMMVIRQTQVRHETYAGLFALQKDYRKMHTEEQRLLIEQQTFSATPVVAKRAVTDLKMFYPDDAHRKVIMPPNFSNPNQDTQSSKK